MSQFLDDMKKLLATMPPSPAVERLGQIVVNLENELRLERAEMREALQSALRNRTTPARG